jgi:hypothetical protein
MSRNVWAALLTGALTLAAGHPSAQTGSGCRPDDDAALARAATVAAGGDGDAAAELLRHAFAASPACGRLGTASWAWHGWVSAAGSAVAGGSPESLSGVRDALGVLEPGGVATGPDAAYAAAVLHAAAAAAQHERAEMRVWLEHAQALVPRLLPGTREWPLPFALAEGELWLAVQDHDLAEAAFTRALTPSPSGMALRGVARARARRGDMAGACAPYKQALAVVDADRPEHPLAVEARAFLRLCP